MKANNDNDTWQPLSLAAGRLLARHEEQEKQGDRDTDRGEAKHEEAREERAYIEKRLKEIAAFERRAAGIKNRTRR